jgi:hypothetical protein
MLPERLLLSLMIALLSLLPAAAGAASTRAPSLLVNDLAAVSRQMPDDGLLILLVSLPDCHFCTTVRSNYLLPMLRDETPALALREISLGVDVPLIDFDGSRTSVSRISKRLKLQVAPTVLFLDRCGQAVAEPLVGGDVAGFYGAYLDRALAMARARLNDVPRAC